MKSFEWSSEKQRAFVFDRNLCVSAGAGSGKTAALVELNSRFLSGDTHLKRITMNQILAITFSEKAAGEMKERIRHKIEERIHNHLELEKDPGRLMLWMEARQALLSAHISTFHSFCLRVLKEHPLEAGIDPLFTIAREKEASELLEDAARQLVFDRLHGGDREVIRLVISTGQAALLKALCATHRKLRACGDEACRLEEHLETQRKECLEELDKAREVLKKLVRDASRIAESGTIKKTLQFSAKIQTLSKGCGEILGHIESLTAESSLEALENLAPLRDAFYGNVPDSVKELKAGIESLVSLKEGKLLLLLRYFNAFPAEQSVARLITALDILYSVKKREHALLDFDDLVAHCRNLLRDNLPVRRSYKDQFRVILVDEFQDTNELQREIVYLLAEQEGEEKPRREGAPPEEIELEECKLFIVGDAKQSIYFFRGADVEVFSRVMDDVRRKGGEIINFQENFRTLEPIIEVINPLFAHLMRKKEREFQIHFTPRDHLQPMRSSMHDRGRVEIVLSEKEGGAAGMRKNEALALAKRIVQLTDEKSGLLVDEQTEEGTVCSRHARWSDVAILFRSLTEVKVYEKALRALNIPYYVVKGRGFFRCQEVLDLMQVLRYVSGINRPYALAGILRSPLAGCTDETLLQLAATGKPMGKDLNEIFLAGDFNTFNPEEKEKLTCCRQSLITLESLKDRLSTAELLEDIVEYFEYPSVLLSTFQGIQKVANLQKLIMLARTFDRGGIGSIEDFIEQVEKDVNSESREAEAQITDEAVDAVKIMSIHQSKGLEFSIVIIPDTGRSVRNAGYEIAYSRKRGIAGHFRDPLTLVPADHYIRNLIKTETREREKAESLRLLYVAITRARDYLILSGSAMKEKESWRNLIIDFLGRSSIEQFQESPDQEQELEIVKELEGIPAPCIFRVRLIKASSLSIEPPCVEKAIIEREPALMDPASKDAATRMKALLKSLPPDEDADQLIQRALHNSSPEPGRLYLSPTSLMTFRFCERKYFYESLFTRSQGLYNALQSECPSQRLHEARGWAAHKALEEMDLSAGEEKSHRFLQHYLIRLSKRHAVLKGLAAPIAEAIQRFLRAPETDKLELTKKSTRLFRELPFHLCLEGSPAIYLGGSMDLMVLKGNGEINLVDYKYTHEKEEGAFDHTLQMRCYTLALRRVLGLLPTRVVVVYLLENPVLFKDIEVTEDLLERFEEEIRDIAGTIMKRRREAGERQWKHTVLRSCKAVDCQFVQRCWRES
jgi:ATP-dependent helicase/nuclease subunit A